MVCLSESVFLVPDGRLKTNNLRVYCDVRVMTSGQHRIRLCCEQIACTNSTRTLAGDVDSDVEVG